MKYSSRINSLIESNSVGLARIVEELREKGEKIISLNIGEPDFPTPVEILEATKKALDQNKTRYSLVTGIKELREKICLKLKNENNIHATPDQIILSNGSKQTLYNIFQTIVDIGDEVIIPSPYWVTIPEQVKLAGGVPVFVETPNLQLDIDLIKEKITNKTVAIYINTPNNPTGAVYPRETLEKLASLCLEKGLYIISDEAYEALVYDGQKHFSIASISKEVFDITFTVLTFSKSYCMTGFRIGYSVANKAVTKKMNDLQSHLTGNNCTFAQYGALQALEMDQATFHHMAEVFEARRNLSYDLITETFDCVRPTGAFYLFPSIEKFKGDRFKTSDDIAAHILKEAKVAILPGSAFGDDRFIRISYAYSEDDIREGLTRIKKALQ